MKKLLAAAISLLAFSLESPAARAGDHCPVPDAGEGVLAGRLMPQGPDAWKPRRVPLQRNVTAALDKLDYGGESPVVHEIDLNEDGHKELLIASPAGRLCGNGGCPYVLLAAGSLATIGEFFGHMAVLDERINGFRIIQSYSHVGAGFTSLETYVFDGSRYRLVTRVVLESCGFDQWQRRMHR